MEFKDILGAGQISDVGFKYLEKLTDICVKSLGRPFKHIFDKKDIDTKIYEAEKLAEVEVNKQRSLLAVKVEAINLLSSAINQNSQQNISIEDEKLKIISPEKDKLVIEQKAGETNINLTTNNIENRAIDRLFTQQIRKQDNIEKVLQIAYNETANEQEVSGEPVNEDWLNRFFNYAEDVSNEDMQTIWGKILAGEIKQPNSYSIRVLELLKNITKSEADVFLEFVKYSFFSGGRDCVLQELVNSDENNLKFENLLLLTELNLLSLQPLKLRLDDNGIVVYGKWILRMLPKYDREVHVFSLIGSQLAKLATDVKDLKYLKSIPNLKMEYTLIINFSSEGIEYDNDAWQNIDDLE